MPRELFSWPYKDCPPDDYPIKPVPRVTRLRDIQGDANGNYPILADKVEVRLDDAPDSPFCDPERQWWIVRVSQLDEQKREVFSIRSWHQAEGIAHKYAIDVRLDGFDSVIDLEDIDFGPGCTDSVIPHKQTHDHRFGDCCNQVWQSDGHGGRWREDDD